MTKGVNEMANAPKIDPITFEVVRHRLWSINQEGSQTVIHVSGSPVVHATDYNFGIYTRDGEMAVIGIYLLVPIYTGAMAIREFISRWSVIEPGDVFIINDPYLAAEHQNDVQFCAPFFYKGELVAWTGCMAHQVDLGGSDPGSWCPTATDVYQEGLRIPPGKIVSAGKVNQELWDIIIANSRMPFTVSNDFTAFLAAHRVAQERLTELCDKYGADTVTQVMQQSIEDSERKFRSLLMELPDGEFYHESYLDRPAADNSTEVLTIRCKMTKSQDRLVFDFNGSSPQVTGYGNATRAGTVGAVATLMLCVFGSSISWNHGLMRPVEVIADDRLCVTATLPAPVSGGAAGANWVAMNAAAGCLSKMLSFHETYAQYAFGPGDGSWQLAQFGGLNQYGEPYAAMYLDSLLWGGPAFAFRDGVDSGGAMVILGGGTQDVEQQEVMQPLMYLWRREVPNSGGAGRHRGGNGIEFALTPIDTDEVIGTLATHGVALPNRTGIFGGYPGSCARYEVARVPNLFEKLAQGKVIHRLADLSESYRVLPSVTSNYRFYPGDIVNTVLQNGGGYGDPLDRPVDQVVRDVLTGAVTSDWAARVYGVIVAGGAADAAATERQRQEIRRQRLAAMIPPKVRPDPASVNIKPGPDVRSWGDSLIVEWKANGIDLFCLHCKTFLGTTRADWKDVVGIIRSAGNQFGPLVVADNPVWMEQYICPHCGASLWVDVITSDFAGLSDFSLQTSEVSQVLS
jgi:N-methylhydantoinase B